jgi:hypothetical protein
MHIVNFRTLFDSVELVVQTLIDMCPESYTSCVYSEKSSKPSLTP